VLGAVQAYDREHDIELVRTVQTWMERDRQNALAAQALQLHPNALAYRLLVSRRSVAGTSNRRRICRNSGWLCGRSDTLTSTLLPGATSESSVSNRETRCIFAELLICR
jgi:hypothetical protein